MTTKIFGEYIYTFKGVCLNQRQANTRARRLRKAGWIIKMVVTRGRSIARYSLWGRKRKGKYQIS